MPESELVGRLRAANTRLRELLAVKDGELQAALTAKARESAELREALRELTLRVAELERQRGSGSDDSGTPTSKESIAAKARRKGERKARDTDTSSRERSAERSRGGQPGHPGRGLVRDRDPQHRERVDPPTECRGCGGDLAGADDAGTAWSQCWDVRVIRWRSEYLLPRRRCACTVVSTGRPPMGCPINGIGYGPVLNTAAVALTAFGNVPTERAAHLVGMLTGQEVSPGFVDRANARLGERLTAAGFDEALLAALLGEPVLTADESPVEVVTPTLDKDTGQPVGAPHVLVLRTPDERLVRLTASDSRRHADVLASLRTFTGYLIVDGFTGYQKLIPAVADPGADDFADCAETACDPAGQAGPSPAITGMLAGIQQCCQHITRRCKQVTKLGPGSLQSWASKIITILGEAHTKVRAAQADGHTNLDPQILTDLRTRYDAAVAVGITHNRHRDWHEGNHPGYTLASWLAKHTDQVWLFTTNFAVDWTSNAAERGIKPAKRHQAVSGYWQNPTTLARWCLINSYLTSARNHGLTVLDAITRALTGNPWLPKHAPA